LEQDWLVGKNKYHFGKAGAEKVFKKNGQKEEKTEKISQCCHN
jgi:hypothetical protein